MARRDDSGHYPVIVGEPDGPFFAREAEPDEGYTMPWVIIHEPSGEHFALAVTEQAAGEIIDGCNRNVARGWAPFPGIERGKAVEGKETGPAVS